MKKQFRKVAGVILLALAIAISQVPASLAEAVSPETNFKRDGNTLISYTGTASVVSVPDGIQTIGTDAFAGNLYIESVIVPSSVKVIENGAFRDCPLLDSVYFSEGLQTIESGAFSMCPELDTVKFSGTIMDLGAGVFSGDRELNAVDLGENSYYVMMDGALYNRDKTNLIQVFAGRSADTFDMPDTVTDIERYAFWGCKNLEVIELSAHLTEIPEYSFSNCENLSEISIPYSIRRIAAKAFEDCISLENIILPPSVIDIHQTAFDGCYDLKITAQEGTPAYEFAQAFESTNILLLEQDTETVSDNTIGSVYIDSAPGKRNEAEEEKEADEEKEEKETKESEDIVKIDVYDPANPADVSKLNVSDYYGPDSSDVLGTTRVVAGNAVVLYNGSGVQEVTEVPTAEEIFEPDFTAADDGSHIIAKKKYYQNMTFKKLTMEGTIEKIDDFAFSRSSAEHVVIPEGVKYIGYGAFYHCDALARVEIPSTVTTIEPKAFEETNYLSSWKNSDGTDDFLVVGDGILLAYKGNAERVYLPENIKKIAAEVFQNHPEIKEVVLNDALLEIGEDAFSGCTSLVKVSGGNQINKICDRAFAMCPLLTLTINESVAEIGLGAYKLATPHAVVFTHDKKLPSVSYEKTATRLENKAYRSLVFSDIKTAVVSNENIELTNTILDERYMGFRGIVVTIPEEDSGEAKLIYCTLYPDEKSGLVEVPASVRVGDKNYSIKSAVPDAFDAYETYEYWGKNEIKGIILPPSLGKLTDYDTQFTFSTEIGTDAENAEQENEQENTSEPYVTTVVLSAGYENADKIKANSLDDDEKYILYVDSVNEEQKNLEKAVKNVYGQLVDGQLVMTDLMMVEAESNVPISNFGNTKVEISLPISETMSSQNICAVTLGEDGTLQTIYGTKKKSDGQNYFVFRTNHFSTYGIYAGIGEIGETIKAESNRLLQKDDSPETGEKFDPKWILVLGCILAGLALLINPQLHKRQ